MRSCAIIHPLHLELETAECLLLGPEHKLRAHLFSPDHFFTGFVFGNYQLLI
jgi:hypothetical protein